MTGKLTFAALNCSLTIAILEDCLIRNRCGDPT
jgi:hypothetical protein